MLTIIVFVLILGLLIFVHELGHFFVARRNGIKAEEFGFGFPPRILGIQFLEGKKHEKTMEVESIQIEKIDIKIGNNEEIIRETITEKIKKVDEIVPVKKWRIIWGSKDGDSASENIDLAEAHKNQYKGGTIYSLNWLPLGGFVKIRGEDGTGKDDPLSFAGKSAFTRIRVLAAGVLMNFVLAWFLISIVFMLGAPEESGGKNIPNSKIQIAEVVAGTPAENAGLKIGDEIAKKQISPNGGSVQFNNIEDIQKYINSQKGNEITLNIKRGQKNLQFIITPRTDNPENQGPLGISMAETAIVSYPWYKAIWKGLVSVLELIGLMLSAFWGIITNLIFGKGLTADVAGPVGIAVLTKQVTTLGLVYILQFAAILSINLGIINALPIPALDGGRILFILIEKIKGSPVSQKVEQIIHTTGFILLLSLMALITLRDVWKIVK